MPEDLKTLKQDPAGVTNTGGLPHAAFTIFKERAHVAEAEASTLRDQLALLSAELTGYRGHGLKKDEREQTRSSSSANTTALGQVDADHIRDQAQLIKELDEHLSSCRAELETVNARCKRRKEQLSASAAALSEAQEKLAEAAEESRQAAKALRKELKNITKLRDEAVEQVETLSNEVSRQLEQIAQLSDDLESKEKQCKKLSRDLETTKQRNGELKDLNHAMTIQRDDYASKLQSHLDGVNHGAESTGWYKWRDGRLDNAPERPEFSRILPCVSTITDPSVNVSQATKDKCGAYDISYFPDPLVWYNGTPMKGYFLYLPHKWDANTANGRGKWNHLTQPTKLIGQTQEVFYRWKGASYYAGTYRFLETPHLPVEEYTQLPTYIKESIVRSSFEKIDVVPPVVVSFVRSSCESGVIKVSCIGLECVGFNEQLYENVKRRSGLDTDGAEEERHSTPKTRVPAKRKSSQSHGGGKKGKKKSGAN